MKLAIMQPYFLPYVGYFQLIGAVDQFVVYDNIKYTKKGWINRNRFLREGADALFTLPLQQASDHLDVRERWLAADFSRDKLLRQWHGAYAKAPCFQQAYPVLEQIVRYEDDNLFRYLLHSITVMCQYLALPTPLITSSTVPADHDLQGQARVLSICEAAGADTYINPPGGMALYDRADFLARGVTLQFLQARAWSYPQFGQPFVPWLSMVDVIMFNPLPVVREAVLHGYDLV